jgi:hypothetical protein
MVTSVPTSGVVAGEGIDRREHFRALARAIDEEMAARVSWESIEPLDGDRERAAYLHAIGTMIQANNALPRREGTIGTSTSPTAFRSRE